MRSDYLIRPQQYLHVIVTRPIMVSTVSPMTVPVISGDLRIGIGNNILELLEWHRVY